jgi:hypothetical protein
VAYPMGEARLEPLRVGFDRRIKLEFHGVKITSDGGLLAYGELDDAFGLSPMSRDRVAGDRVAVRPTLRRRIGLAVLGSNCPATSVPEQLLLLLPARWQRLFQLLQHQRLIGTARQDRLDDVRSQQREPQDPADVALRDVLGVSDLADRGVDALIEHALPGPRAPAP